MNSHLALLNLKIRREGERAFHDAVWASIASKAKIREQANDNLPKPPTSGETVRSNRPDNAQPRQGGYGSAVHHDRPESPRVSGGPTSNLVGERGRSMTAHHGFEELRNATARLANARQSLEDAKFLARNGMANNLAFATHVEHVAFHDWLRVGEKYHRGAQ
jgi:hypothetical protein